MLRAEKLNRPATRADLDALPSHLRGEILDGALYVMTRPRVRHARVAASILGDLEGPFSRGRSGPGGWLIVAEPGIELPGSPEVSPDLAGWRNERLGDLRPDEPLRVVPDWVCEIYSPSTRGYDNLVKRAFYARHGVRWLWYVDPDDRTLAASRLVDGQWLELGVVGNDARCRLEPFADVELDLASWWLPEE